MSVDFSKHPIYFFDDDDKNYDKELVEKRESFGGGLPPIKFVPIEGGHETSLPPGVFEGAAVPALRYYAGAGFLNLTAGAQAALVGDPHPHVTGVNLTLGCCPYVHGRGGDGHPIALVFDWDKTLTLRNGGYNGTLSLETQAKLLGEGWDTKKLAKWYLHDPDDATRIENLSSFFRAAQTAEVPIFILTKNSLGKSDMFGGNRKLLSDILKEGLNLERAPVPPQNIICSDQKTATIMNDIILHRLRERIAFLRTKYRLEMGNKQARGRASPAPGTPRGSATAPAQDLTPGKGSKRGDQKGRDNQRLSQHRGMLKSDPPSAGDAAAANADAEMGGGRRKTRRRKRKKRKRRRRRTRRRHRNDFDKELKRVIAQHRRYQIARGDKRFKATRRLVKWSRPNKTKRKNRVYYRKRKSRKKR